MNLLKKVLPHISIILSVMFIVFIILDDYNPTMNFVNNSISTGLLLGLCIVSFINSIIIIYFHRK